MKARRKRGESEEHGIEQKFTVEKRSRIAKRDRRYIRVLVGYASKLSNHEI